MILDLVCIIMALFTRIIKSNSLSNFTDKVIIGRYLNSNNKSEVFLNESYDLFSNSDAINKVFDF